MKNKSALVAWTLCGLLTIVFLFNLGRIAIGGQDITSKSLGDLIWGVIGIIFAVVGALIISRLPRNVIGWLLILPTLIIVVQPVVSITLSSVTAPPDSPSLLLWLAFWFSGTSWVLLIFPIFLIALLFPTGVPTSPRWRWVVAYAIAMAVFFDMVSAFTQKWKPDPEVYGVTWTVANPIGFIPPDIVERIFSQEWALALGLLALLCAVSLLVRYRRAGSIEKKQIQWVLWAGTLFACIYVIGFVQDTAEGSIGDFVNALLFLGVLGIPVSIGISILRYRLFDIDIIIQRTVTYALVTVLLAGVFFGSVVVLQQLFASFTESGSSEIITVLSTLAIAALFVPLRNRIQNQVDKRFNRKKYDAQQVLNDFANTVRDETDLEKLSARLLQVVDETMQPKTVSLWLKEDKGQLAK